MDVNSSGEHPSLLQYSINQDLNSFIAEAPFVRGHSHQKNYSKKFVRNFVNTICYFFSKSKICRKVEKNQFYYYFLFDSIFITSCKFHFISNLMEWCIYFTTLLAVSLKFYASKTAFCIAQGTLHEGGGSVQLTSLYQLVQISRF